MMTSTDGQRASRLSGSFDGSLIVDDHATLGRLAEGPPQAGIEPMYGVVVFSQRTIVPYITLLLYLP